MKRLLDIILVLLAVIMLLPLFVPLIIILRLTGEGKIFYLQPRIGYKGKVFQLYKFATMLENSPNIGSGTITLENDPRVLPLGGFLRKTKINELPQLLNVLKGDISLVGPRPQTEECFGFFPKEYQEDLKQLIPGVTGIGSIFFRDEESIIGKSSKSYDDCYREDIMPYKARLELWYKENRSISCDLKIIFTTAYVILFSKNESYKKFFKGLPKA